jgi:predicted TIM-barrel fold metal-dependent hydrolase
MVSIHARNAHQAAAGHTDNEIAVVDAHHHLWDLASGHYPWLQDAYDEKHFFLGAYDDICRNFLPEDYLNTSANHKIMATVHIEAERDRAEQLDETAWLHQVNQKHGFPNAVVAYAAFDAPDLAAQLAKHAAFALVRGIRCKPVTAAAPDHALTSIKGTMHDTVWLDGLSQLEQYGWSWDARVPSWHLDDLARVAADFRNIPIALNHTGLPWDRSKSGLALWRRRLEQLAEEPNVSIKLSEFGVRDHEWNPDEVIDIIRQAVAIFGPTRCMFASNFPVSRVKVSYDTLLATFAEALKHHDRSDVENIMANNALRFYKIASKRFAQKDCPGEAG